MKKGLKLFVLLAVSAVGGCMYGSGTSTYSGQCGPVFFDGADLEFGMDGSVTAIEKGGQKISLSNMPCIYRKDQ